MYTLTDMRRDSQRVMKEYRYHKFTKTWTHFALVLATIPIILLSRTKRSKSIILAFLAINGAVFV